jgi:CheY-like chemotaxis protein
MAVGRRYDLIVIDWGMESMDGIETLTRIRTLLGKATPPSILMTMSDDAGVHERALESEFNATMLKPVTAPRLQGTIATAPNW